MKIALTVWGKWISPVFDSACTLLIADVEDGAIENRQLMTFEADHPAALAKMLENQEVSALICGAISEYPAKVLECDSLKLIPFISGKAETILETIAEGKSIVPLYLMPGCKIRNLLAKNCQFITGSGSPGNRCCRKIYGRPSATGKKE